MHETNKNVINLTSYTTDCTVIEADKQTKLKHGVTKDFGCVGGGKATVECSDGKLEFQAAVESCRG